MISYRSLAIGFVAVLCALAAMSCTTPQPTAEGVATSVGGSHSCAVLSDGTARCWGDNSQGQLGDGTTADRPSPVTVAGLTGI